MQLSSAWLHPLRSWCNGCKGPNMMLPLQPCLVPSPALKQVLCFIHETVTHFVALQPFVRLEPITHDPCVLDFSCTGRLWPCLVASWVSNVPYALLECMPRDSCHTLAGKRQFAASRFALKEKKKNGKDDTTYAVLFTTPLPCCVI